MGFRKLFASMGVGGASVETVLAEPNVVPGGVVQGEVRVRGGSVAQEIQKLSVGLVAGVEVGGNGEKYTRNVEFHRVRLGGAFELQPGVVHAVPFGLDVPWETPVTVVAGRRPVGTDIGVTTELAIAKAVDSGDIDPVHVHPLPAQQAILDAFGDLGFRFLSAEVERGPVPSTRQRLPLHQEIGLAAPPQYRGLGRVELCFAADGREMDVVMEMDKRPGPFTESSDSYRAFTVDLEDFRRTDWTAYVNQWLAEVGSRRSWS